MDSIAMIDNSKWKKIEKSLDDIPSLSPVVSKVMSIANDITASPRDLMKVISLDPVLTGKVLKLVNSAYFGIPNEITSLNRALIQLGVNTIKNLALSTAVMGVMRVEEEEPPINVDEFWKHSIGVAAGSKILAKLKGVPKDNCEDYFICGLLHDIGKIPLIRFFPQDFKSAMEITMKRNCNLTEAEDLVYANNHSAIGAMLGERWKLSNELQFVIANHHDPMRPSEFKQMNQIVYITNNYCKRNTLGFSGNTYVEPQFAFIAKVLGFSEDDIFDVFEVLPDEIEKAKVFLNVAKQK